MLSKIALNILHMSCQSLFKCVILSVISDNTAGMVFSPPTFRIPSHVLRAWDLRFFTITISGAHTNNTMPVWPLSLREPALYCTFSFHDFDAEISAVESVRHGLAKVEYGRDGLNVEKVASILHICCSPVEPV